MVAFNLSSATLGLRASFSPQWAIGLNKLYPLVAFTLLSLRQEVLIQWRAWVEPGAVVWRRVGRTQRCAAVKFGSHYEDFVVHSHEVSSLLLVRFLPRGMWGLRANTGFSFLLMKPLILVSQAGM